MGSDSQWRAIRGIAWIRSEHGSRCKGIELCEFLQNRLWDRQLHGDTDVSSSDGRAGCEPVEQQPRGGDAGFGYRCCGSYERQLLGHYLGSERGAVGDSEGIVGRGDRKLCAQPGRVDTDAEPERLQRKLWHSEL